MFFGFSHVIFFWKYIKQSDPSKGGGMCWNKKKSVNKMSALMDLASISVFNFSAPNRRSSRCRRFSQMVGARSLSTKNV